MPRLRRIRLAALVLALFAGTTHGNADELPPGLEEAILNPRIPMIVDATILSFNKDGHAAIKVNSVYRPTRTPGEKAVIPSSTVRGYASSGKPERIVPIKILTDRGKSRFLFFLDGDLLFSTYNNRFEIRESEKKQLIVHTGRAWKPLKDIVKLIPKTAPLPAGSDDEARLRQSLKKWKKARKDCGGNYSYTTRLSDPDFDHETEVTVRKNRVVERRYRALRRPTRPGGVPGKPAVTEWVEKGANLGSHEQGAPARTLDELYTEAARVIKRKLLKHERRSLVFDKQGLLGHCFTFEPRTVDDASGNSPLVHRVAIKGVALRVISIGKPDDGGNTTAPKKVYRAPNGKAYPPHWGAPPRRQTRDLRPLPGGYGRGSSTLGRWIGKNLERDAAGKAPKKR